jgi:translation initiation factor 2 alpha subunit (eIF-2alpha)
MENQVEEGQIVLCTVEKIMGTTVFVTIEDDGEGTITTSEISPGRIRNLRKYVTPGKKIVCKVLNTRNGVHLSLRRVKQNEKKELLDKIKKEKSYKAMLKTAFKEDFEKIINKITKDYSLTDFFEEVKSEPKLLDKYLNKNQAQEILKILESKKDKPKEIKQIIKISSKSPQGIIIIKKIIQNANKEQKAEISYLAAGKYRITLTGPDFKQLKTQTNSITQEIEKQAKKQSCEFELEKSK